MINVLFQCPICESQRWGEQGSVQKCCSKDMIPVGGIILEGELTYV